MKDPAPGPFLFDTSAERWLATARDPALVRWYREYTSVYMVCVSAVTVMERIRGYALVWHKRPPDRRIEVDLKRINYLNTLTSKRRRSSRS
jgi:hypothetical protein